MAHIYNRWALNFSQRLEQFSLFPGRQIKHVYRYTRTYYNFKNLLQDRKKKLQVILTIKSLEINAKQVQRIFNTW